MNLQDIKDIAPWVSSGIAFATLFINSLPKFKAWCRKEQKRIRLNRFFHDLKQDGWNRYLNFSFVSLSVFDYRINYLDTTPIFTLIFYQYQNIFFNQNESAKLNGISLKVGYHLYEIISDDCIRLDFIDDDSGERKSVFIYRYNNVDKKNKKNLELFNKITSWKYN